MASKKQSIPPALRWEVWARDNHRCVYCGANKFLAVDHKVPESKGGSTTLDNLLTACGKCNSAKGTMNSDEFAERRAFQESLWVVLAETVSFAVTDEALTEIIKKAHVRMALASIPNVCAPIKQFDHERGLVREYWIVFTNADEDMMIDLIRDRLERGEVSDVHRFTAIAVAKFGVHFLERFDFQLPLGKLDSVGTARNRAEPI